MLQPSAKMTKVTSLVVEGNVAIQWTISDDKATSIEEQVTTGVQNLVKRVVERMAQGEYLSAESIGSEVQQIAFPKVLTEFMNQKVPLPWAGRATIRVGERFPTSGLLAQLYVHDGKVMEIDSVLADQTPPRPRQTGPMRKGTTDAR